MTSLWMFRSTCCRNTDGPVRIVSSSSATKTASVSAVACKFVCTCFILAVYLCEVVYGTDDKCCA